MALHTRLCPSQQAATRHTHALTPTARRRSAHLHVRAHTAHQSSSTPTHHPSPLSPNPLALIHALRTAITSAAAVLQAHALQALTHARTSCCAALPSLVLALMLLSPKPAHAGCDERGVDVSAHTKSTSNSNRRGTTAQQQKSSSQYESEAGSIHTADAAQSVSGAAAHRVKQQSHPQASHSHPTAHSHSHQHTLSLPSHHTPSHNPLATIATDPSSSNTSQPNNTDNSSHTTQGSSGEQQPNNSTGNPYLMQQQTPDGAALLGAEDLAVHQLFRAVQPSVVSACVCVPVCYCTHCVIC